MDLPSLYHLRDRLADEKYYLELSSLMADDPARQQELDQWSGRIGTLLAEVRGEVMSREAPGARPTGTNDKFDTYLRSTLDMYATLDALDAVHAEVG